MTSFLPGLIGEVFLVLFLGLFVFRFLRSVALFGVLTYLLLNPVIPSLWGLFACEVLMLVDLYFFFRWNRGWNRNSSGFVRLVFQTLGCVAGVALGFRLRMGHL